MFADIRQYVLVLLLLAAQIGFWTHAHTIKPQLGIVPEPVSKATLQAVSFGDTQFIFRLMGLTIQNAGDSFGRFTALKLYDYKKLHQWFLLLDSLDRDSDFVAPMASYYYSQTQKYEDVRYVVDYLYQHASDRVETKWWWLVQAIYLADHKVKDKNLALQVAKPLIGARNIPVWAQQMPAFVYEKRGEGQQAAAIMQGIIQGAESGTIPENDMRFMKYFLDERLKAEGLEIKQK